MSLDTTGVLSTFCICNYKSDTRQHYLSLPMGRGCCKGGGQMAGLDLEVECAAMQAFIRDDRIFHTYNPIQPQIQPLPPPSPPLQPT